MSVNKSRSASLQRRADPGAALRDALIREEQRKALEKAVRARQARAALERGARTVQQRQALEQLSSPQVREALLRQLERTGDRFNGPAGSPPIQPTDYAPPLPPVPAGPLRYDGGMEYDPEVEQLQRALVMAGYLTEEEMATGPGYYGERTREAVAELHADAGIPADGTTFNADSQRALLETLRTQGATAPQAPEEVTPSTGSTVTDVPLMNQYAPDGATGDNYWNGGSNCGPTSAAMLGRAFGFGEGLSDAEFIMQMHGAGGTTEAGSSPEQVAVMLRSMGLDASVVEDPGLAELDAALASGNPVIANGDFYATGVPGRDGSLQSGHFVVIAGKDENGNYIVKDPAGGQEVLFTPEAMSNFFTEHSYDGALVVVN